MEHYSSNPDIEFLDKSKSNFSCVFCLSSGERDLRLHGDSDSDSSGMKCPSATLRNISRYLQIRPPEMSSSSNWYICPKCSKLAVEFNDLFHLGEEIKLRLNWCLHKFQDVMTQNEKENKSEDDLTNFWAAIECRSKEIISVPRVALCKIEIPENKKPLLLPNECPTDEMDLDTEADKNLKSENNSEEDNDPDGDLQNFRAPIKSRTKEITSLPRAAVCQVQVPENPLLNECPADATDCFDAESYDNIGMKMECDNNPTDSETSDSVSQNSAKAEASSENLHGQQTCSYCRAEFQGRDVEMSLGLHIVQYHCDTLFPDCKLDSVTSSEFKKLVGELLFKDLISEPGKCAYCSKKFEDHKETKRTVDASQIKRHLIDEHFNEMKEKLKEIQNTPNISTKLIECNPMGESCECGVYLPTFGARTSHVEFHCPLVAKNKQFPPPKFTMRANPDVDVVSNFVTTSSSKLECKWCHASVANRHIARRHWKYFCKKGKKLPLPVPKVVGTLTLTCQYCSFECANLGHGAGSYYMKRHFVRKHPRHFFPDEISEESSAWKHEHFDSIFHRVLFPQFGLQDATSMSWSCSLCGAKYKGRDDLCIKMHLISRHKHQLRDSLKKILEEADASLEEMIGGEKEEMIPMPKSNMNRNRATKKGDPLAM